MAESIFHKEKLLGDIHFTAPKGNGVFLNLNSLGSLEALLRLSESDEIRIGEGDNPEILTYRNFREKYLLKAAAVYASETPMTIFNNLWISEKNPVQSRARNRPRIAEDYRCPNERERDKEAMNSPSFSRDPGDRPWPDF